MSERRRFRDRSQRPSGGGQTSGQTRPNNGAGNGPQRGGQHGQQRRYGGGGGQHRGNGQNGQGGQGGQGGGRQEPAAPPIAAGAAVEGLLSIRDENSDGVLRDPAYPLRPAPGNVVVPRNVIREMNLRPGLLVKGVPQGRTLTKLDMVENGPPRSGGPRSRCTS